MEGPHQPLLDSIRGMFNTMDPPLTSECCIYRVGGSLRKQNEAAYTPRVISIGPFHRGKEELRTMEKHKERYLYHFLHRAKVIRLEDLVSSIQEWEERVRRCYAEALHELNSDDFVKMILLDGAFIIEFFLRFFFMGMVNENDKVVWKPWLEINVRSDLKLLENQLPFFVLEKLYNLAFLIEPYNDQQPSFLEIVCHYFSDENKQNMSPQGLEEEVKHFTDLVRTFQLPPSPISRLPPKENIGNEFSYSATELHEAGVKFKVGESKCLFDIQFANGVLQIPHIGIFDGTEAYIRNLMALEQCHCPSNTYYICNFVVLMDTLINNAKDVEILVQNGIIMNGLGDNDVVATLFNNLGREIVHDWINSYFCRMGQDLTEYYKIPWHRWKAILRRDYFSTPWRIASIVAAAILLALTFMQTVNSFISL